MSLDESWAFGIFASFDLEVDKVTSKNLTLIQVQTTPDQMQFFLYIFFLILHIHTFLELPSSYRNTVPKDPPAPHLSELRQLTRTMTHHDSLESAIRKHLGDEKNLPRFEKSQWETVFFAFCLYTSPYIPVLVFLFR